MKPDAVSGGASPRNPRLRRFALPCFSAFAGNPTSSVPLPLAVGLLARVTCRTGRTASAAVDYGPVIEWKRTVLIGLLVISALRHPLAAKECGRLQKTGRLARGCALFLAIKENLRVTMECMAKGLGIDSPKRWQPSE